LVECNVSEKNHTTQDARSSNCCVMAYVAHRQKSWEPWSKQRAFSAADDQLSRHRRELRESLQATFWLRILRWRSKKESLRNRWESTNRIFTGRVCCRYGAMFGETW